MHAVEDDTTVSGVEGFVEVMSGEIVMLSRDFQPTGDAVPIGPEPCVVGRGGHCNLSVPDPLVSTTHFKLTATEGGICITDTESKNGTWVNQVRLRRGQSGSINTTARVCAATTWFEVRVTGREHVPISSASSFGPLVGRSPAMRELYARLARIAPTDLSVLITGETGTGKEVAARAIHTASRRKDAPFVTIDCSTISPALAESTLFGHEKGAFTGATSRQDGLFVTASGGTIFLDEMGELPPELQPKLLRALQTKEIRSVGGKDYRPIDVRVIAATLRDLHRDVNDGRFRADLLHRFNKVELHLPPLRERREDIPDLMASMFAEFGDPAAVTRLDEASRDRLMRYEWPGNVRELRNVLEVAFEFSQGGPIEIQHLGGARRPAVRLSADRSYEEQRREHIAAFDLAYLTALLRQTNGNLSEVARLARVDRKTLRERLERLGLRKEE